MFEQMKRFIRPVVFTAFIVATGSVFAGIGHLADQTVTVLINTEMQSND